MNRMIARIVTLAALSGAVVLGAQGLALANEAHGAHGSGEHAKHRRGHGEGLVREALKLDSLTPEQRTQIEQLVQERKSASVPVRAADAQVLTGLAHQVEQAAIDPQGLQAQMSVEQQAVRAERAADQDALVKLHAILTPAQRAQLVDGLEASMARAEERAEKAGAREQKEKAGGETSEAGAAREHGGGKLGLSADQRAQIRANLRSERTPKTADQIKAERDAHKAALESFRGDSFDAAALVRVASPGERATNMAKAVVPVLSPAQRATYAAELRARAARETSR